MLQLGTFFSDLGGILGLYIGFSLLTILEFGELFFDFLVLGILKLLGKSSNTNTTKVQPVDLHNLKNFYDEEYNAKTRLQ